MRLGQQDLKSQQFVSKLVALATLPLSGAPIRCNHNTSHEAPIVIIVSMAATRIPSATIASCLHQTLEQRAISRLPRIAQCFRPVYSRASCSSAQNGNFRYLRAPSGSKSSHVTRVNRVGAFSTSIIRRAKQDDATSSSQPQQVGPVPLFHNSHGVHELEPSFFQETNSGCTVRTLVTP
jgi:hypothetical protein